MQNPFIVARQTDSDGVERIDLRDGGYLIWIPRFLSVDETGPLFRTLHATLSWEQSIIKIYGREMPIPRLNAWYGDAGRDYRYSGTRFRALPWTPELQSIRDSVNQRLSLSFNSVLANLYRDGSDAMGWHSDNEPELGEMPAIASLSMGGGRRFLLRPRKESSAEHQMEFQLDDGSLLLMAGTVQTHWRHSVPRTRKPAAPRINLTFRRII